jgi:HlyD family secretion protein
MPMMASSFVTSRWRLLLLLVIGAGGGIALWAWLDPLHLVVAAQGSVPVALSPANLTEVVSSLGRLEPKGRVMRVAGPSQPGAVIAELRVNEGDQVHAGDVIAVLDTFAVEQATLARLELELGHAQAESHRRENLYRKSIVSASEREDLHTQVEVARAKVQEAHAKLDLNVVRAPISGTVLKVHAYPGERIGSDGIVELGDTDEMYAVAEVYETDIGKVRVGQRAVIKSPALPGEVQGTVERIGQEIGKRDVLDTDPGGDFDARVVEVYVRLADDSVAKDLTYLSVEVFIFL